LPIHCSEPQPTPNRRGVLCDAGSRLYNGGVKQSCWRLAAGGVGALGLALACGVPSSGYAEAGAGLATAVAFTGVNRAITGDCWAVCSLGYACDRVRGTCVRAECVPECASGEQCIIEQDGRFRCIDTLGTITLSGKVPDAGSALSTPADAGAVADAASTGSADY
jgi:hypothetical protein